MKRALPLLLIVALSGCSMFEAVESLPAQLSETNQHLARAGDQVIQSNALLETSNQAMAGLPAMMAVTNAGVEETNALMEGTHTLMAGTNELMRNSNRGVERTNELMVGTQELMDQTHALMQASNAQLRATYWLILGTCVLSGLAGLFLYVQFRKIPRQLDESLALARAQHARATAADARAYSHRIRQASGLGTISGMGSIN